MQAAQSQTTHRMVSCGYLVIVWHRKSRRPAITCIRKCTQAVQKNNHITLDGPTCPHTASSCRHTSHAWKTYSSDASSGGKPSGMSPGAVLLPRMALLSLWISAPGLPADSWYKSSFFPPFLFLNSKYRQAHLQHSDSTFVSPSRRMDILRFGFA